MTQRYRFLPLNAGVLSVLGALAALPFLPAIATAQTSPLNPCPGIYYEEPFDSTRIVPQGCPANTATQQQLNQTGQTPDVAPQSITPSQGVNPIQPPFPDQGNALTNVSLANGFFDVRMTNTMNVPVYYEVVGQTDRRYLQSGEEVVLQGIPAPATIALVREDNGFVEVIPATAVEPGLLSISLIETPSTENQGVLQIQENGQVFVN